MSRVSPEVFLCVTVSKRTNAASIITVVLQTEPLLSHPVRRNSIKRELFLLRTRRILLIKQRSGPHGKSREINVNLFPIHATFAAPIKKSAVPNTSLLHTDGLVPEHSQSKEEHTQGTNSFCPFRANAQGSIFMLGRSVLSEPVRHTIHTHNRVSPIYCLYLIVLYVDLLKFNFTLNINDSPFTAD